MITKEILEEYLNKIGFKLRHYGCLHYRIYTNWNRDTGFIFFSDRIEMERKYDLAVYFYLKDCVIELLDPPCVCIRAKNDRDICIHFRNFTDKQKKKKLD